MLFYTLMRLEQSSLWNEQGFGNTARFQKLILQRCRDQMLSDGPAPAGHERQSLVDLFCEFSKSPREFLQYDNGYRSWQYTYAQGRRRTSFCGEAWRSQGLARAIKSFSGLKTVPSGSPHFGAACLMA